MDSANIRCCAAGDALLIDRLARGSAKMKEIRERICANDVALVNVEATLHRCEADVYPSRSSGGDWVSADPAVLSDLKWLGFNLFSAPNNHSLDWLHTGVARTIDAFEKARAIYAGIGMDLAEAEAPRYLSTPNGRVAIIALNLSYEDWHPAGEQRRDCQGRPGINYVGHQKTLGVPAGAYAALCKLSEAYPEQVAREGDGRVRIGSLFFEEGETQIRTEADEGDVARLRRSIERARRQADVVLVSVHSHENRDGDRNLPAAFEEALAHACIDFGASAYIGHGPHVVRGIEIYHGQPIFYSLGNFIYQCELIERSPAEFYRKFASFGPDACTADVFDYREQNGGILGENDPDYFCSVLAEFAFDGDGNLSALSAHPLDLRFTAPRALKGTPAIAEGPLTGNVLGDLIAKSAAFGTKLVRQGNTAVLQL